MFSERKVSFVILLVLAFYPARLLFSQQQINNPGFEFWEEIRSGVYEPMNWNSIKNTDGGKATNRMAPEVISRTESKHNGANAIRLINESTMGIVANGMLTNGAIHGNIDKEKSFVYSDSTKKEFCTRFSSRPDSITGWYQYAPQGNDSAMVVILLHRGYITLPDHGTKNNWVGGVKLILPGTESDIWTRFSAPLQYFNDGKPEFILVVLSAGNRKQAVEGSVALFDDLQLIYNKWK
jgi:hypothetical protein